MNTNWALSPFGGNALQNWNDPFADDWMMGFPSTRGLGLGNMLSNTPGSREIRDKMRGFQPLMSTDIVEGANDFHVCCDLPGVNKEDLNVEVRGDSLVISGERKTLDEHEDFRSHRIERASGKITRSIPIPLGASSENPETTFTNGVLCVKFNKTGDFKDVKRLDIKTG